MLLASEVFENELVNLGRIVHLAHYRLFCTSFSTSGEQLGVLVPLVDKVSYYFNTVFHRSPNRRISCEERNVRHDSINQTVPVFDYRRFSNNRKLL